MGNQDEHVLRALIKDATYLVYNKLKESGDDPPHALSTAMESVMREVFRALTEIIEESAKELSIEQQISFAAYLLKGPSFLKEAAEDISNASTQKN